VKKDYPLFLSVTSDGDRANHVVLPIGQAAARIKMRTRNYWPPGLAETSQPACVGDPADPASVPHQSTYYMHTTASIPALYSHEIVKASADGWCPRGAARASEPWSVGSDRYAMCALDGAWNQTPYRVGSIPVAIVPNHTEMPAQ
jgi:hypothetical protein